MLTQGKNITDKCHAMCNAAKIARNAHLQWNLNYEKVCLHCTNKHTQEHLTPHRTCTENTTADFHLFCFYWLIKADIFM